MPVVIRKLLVDAALVRSIKTTHQACGNRGAWSEEDFKGKGEKKDSRGASLGSWRPEIVEDSPPHNSYR